MGGPMVSRLAILAMAAFSAHVSAQTTTNEIYRLFPVLECPAIGEEYEKMISRLDSIKAAIKEDANCENVTLEVKKLEDLVVGDRQAVLDIVNGTGENPLTAEQAAKVRDYAENVTKKVSAISDLFMRSNQCFKEDHVDDQISSLSGFVSEASQLVSAVAGPWGAPIAIAGNVIAGFLTGLDQIFKSRAGFDFEKREEWMSYVQNLCTYHGYRDQIDHLLNPQARISQLQTLQTTLDNQLKIMTDACAECRAIQAAYDANRSAGATEIKSIVDPSVRAADSRNSKPWGTYTLQSLGLRDWVLAEMKRVEREAQSYWGDVSGRHVLYLAKQQIEDFLIVREAPRFLEHQAYTARKDFQEFQWFAGDVGRGIYDEIERANNQVIAYKVNRSNWNDRVSYFRALVLNPVKFDILPAGDLTEDLRYSWLHFRDQSLLQLRKAQTSAQVMQSFCSFFKHSGQFSPAIRGSCSSEMIRTLIKLENGIEAEVQASPLLVQGDRPMTINPDLEGTVVYSRNKVESLTKGIQSRAL